VPVGADDELDDDGELIGRFLQRGDRRRQLLGQHRKDPDAGIHGRRLARGLLVNRRVLRHVGVDIRDGYHHLGGPVGQSLRHFELIEVPRGVVVDGRPGQAAQVAHSRTWRDRRRLPLENTQLLCHARRDV
jgi:hypothetical protein